MKVFWKEPQRLLQMEAESAGELNVIGDLLHGGPLAGATWLCLPEADVGFVRARGDGIVSLIGGARVVTGLLWDAGAAVKQREALNAYQALGQAIDQFLRLLPVQSQIDLTAAAARVTTVKGDFEEQGAS